MKRDRLIIVFFTLYLIILLSNAAPALGILSKNVASMFIYGGFLFLLFAFMQSFYRINDRHAIVTLYKKSFQLPLFIFVFYIASMIVSLVYMNYDSLFLVLPNLIRCVVSILMLNWLFWGILCKGHLETYLKIFAVVLAISASTVMVFNFLGIELSYFLYADLQSPDGDIIGRSSGVYMNANLAAQFSLYAIILLLYFIQTKGVAVKYRLLILLFLVISVYGVLLTFSTTGFVNLLLVFVYFIFNLYSSKIKFLLHFVLFFFCLQITVLGLMSTKDTLYAKYNLPQVQQDKIDNILNIISFSDSKKINYSSRDELAEIGLARIEQQPFFGYGAGEFMTNILDGLGVHNTYLQIIGEAGIFIFMFYVVVFYRLLRRCYMIQNKSIRFLLISIIITTLIYQLTSHNILYNENILLILIFVNCISVYITYMAKQEKRLKMNDDLQIKYSI